jgi:hypothetical protein
MRNGYWQLGVMWAAAGCAPEARLKKLGESAKAADCDVE